MKTPTNALLILSIAISLLLALFIMPQCFDKSVDIFKTIEDPKTHEPIELPIITQAIIYIRYIIPLLPILLALIAISYKLSVNTTKNE